MVAETEAPKINDLIFKELIKRGYSLEGNTRIWNIADSKLWYLTPDQAQSYLDLEDEKKYKEEVTNKELALIDENIDEILKEAGEGPLNIIDLGCGDGKKVVKFIEKLKGKVKLRYCPIDISGYMVSKAIERIKKLKAGEIVEFQWNISDFENIENITELLRQGEFKKHLILLLGNTLGNFEINELLYEIRSSMKGNDLLVIGNGIDNGKVDTRAESYEKNETVDKFLIKIPFQLGLKPNEIEIGTRFKNSRIELYYTIKKDKTIKFQEKEIQFHEGDQIIVAVGYKYPKEEFMSYLNIHFDDVSAKTSEDETQILALCKK
jgi:uncharacterized SAM-dependent methyltransferase|tara:strand:+ start:316 stop:1278 length:963 start_codon:yes stop_codon:yes gene_type:complete